MHDIETTIVQVERTLEKYKTPALMVSFGKDSMVMLHMLRHLKLPVICHRAPWDAGKWLFANQISALWDLRVYDWAPAWVALQESEDQLELVTCYTNGGSRGVGIRQRIREDKTKGLCGLHDCLYRPRGNIEHTWDVLLSAQKSGDTDHFGGHHKIQCDVHQNKDGADIFYPLRDWSDEEIWSYITTQRCPVNIPRYKAVSQRERDDHDVDLVEGCFACVRKNGERTPKCPRLNNMQVSNISDQVPYIEHSATT